MGGPIRPKRDLHGELTKAVRAKALRMGSYYCLREWYSHYSRLCKRDPSAYVEKEHDAGRGGGEIAQNLQRRGRDTVTLASLEGLS